VTTWTINAHGLRGREADYSKPPGTFRILGVGDSFTFGYTVEEEYTFLHRLEDSLNADTRLAGAPAARRFEALNLGVGGYGPVAETYMLREEGLKYQPDL